MTSELRNPYDLGLSDLGWFNTATQPMRRLDDGSLGPEITLDEATDAMRVAGADAGAVLGSKLFEALANVLSRRQRLTPSDC